MRTPWAPGQRVGTYTPMANYTLRQRRKLEAVYDVYCAAAYGYAHTRQPTPGRRYTSQMEGRRQNVIAQWSLESRRDPSTRPISPDDLPENAWLWLVERLTDAGPTSTGTPFR